MSINDSVQVHNDWDAAYYIIVFCELIPRTDTEDIRNPLLSSLILAAPVVALPVLHRVVDDIEVGQQQRIETHLSGVILHPHGLPKAGPPMFVSCQLFSFGTVCRPAAQPLSSSTAAKSSANTLRYIVFPPSVESGLTPPCRSPVSCRGRATGRYTAATQGCSRSRWRATGWM